ncbi:MAG: histidine kinase N-terminal 7TM domain-containing protein, partial [Candidatus Falkowbacteria bacterium]
MELFFAISGLVNALTSTILGIFVVMKNKKSKANQTFAFFCFCVAAWSYAYIFWPLAKDAPTTLFWFRVLHLGAFYVSVALLHFVAVWLGVFQKKKKLIIFGYVISSFFALFAFSSLFIKEVVPKFSMRYWANPGILYHFYLIHFFSYTLCALYLLIKAYRKSSSIQKMQARFILIGMIITYIAGSTNYFLWYNINIPPYLNIFASAYVISIAYAIIRYRLMDIRVGVRKSFIYIALSTFAYAVFYGVAGAFKTAFGDVFASQGYIIGIFVALAFTGLFFLVQKYSHKFVNKYLYASVYNTQKTLEDLANGLHNLIKLDQIID